MKVAVLIAVLANFAIFFWLRWVTPGTQPLDAGLVATAPVRHPLQLIGDNAGAGHCLLLTPSADATAADAHAARLRRRGFDAHAVTKAQAGASGYWVLLGGFPDTAAAQAAAARLRSGGIEDLLVLSGSQTGQISLSLGLFHDLDHARKRAEHVRALGFQPQIRERFRGTPQWAVQVPATASARAAFPATAATPSACMTPAGGG
ncbi:MAG: SPOR domain-containing protein [Gammaproteobacteria bacterium]